MAVIEIKLCLLGDSGVGKSSIVHRFVYDSFRPYMENTIGAAFLTKTMIVDGRTYKFQIWDTAGQEKYRALAPMYYRGAAAAIVVYDISRESSFHAVKLWLAELKRHASPNIVLAIAGNKNDLEDLREVSYQEAQDCAKCHGAIMIETSAKSAVNVASLFIEIGRRLSSLDTSMSYSSSSSDVLNVNQRTGQDVKGQRKCCGF